MKIDESLARGLCSRFFNEVSDRLENRLYRGKALRKFKQTRASWARFLIDFDTALDKLMLTSYEGGSTRQPYFAFCGLIIDKHREVNHWHERAIQGQQFFFDFDCNLESIPAPFSIGEHAIARMFERGHFNIRQNNEFDVTGILDGFEQVPLWAAFWSRLGFWLQGQGLDINLIEPVIPSRAGLFLGRLSLSDDVSRFPVVEIRTFINNELLSNIQAFVQREMLASSKILVHSPLAFFPLVTVYQIDDLTFLERVLHYKLRSSLSFISLLVTDSIDDERQRESYRNAIAETNQQFANGINDDTISAIDQMGIRAVQVQVRSLILKNGGDPTYG